VRGNQQTACANLFAYSSEPVSLASH